MARRPPLIIGNNGALPPEAPYYYNDPRITYNEPCFYYNGGFDLVCLGITVSPGKLKAGRSGKRKRPSPEPEMVNLLFKTCIEYVDTKYGERQDIEYCETKEYSFKRQDNVSVKAKNFGHNMLRRPIIQSEVKNIVAKHLSTEPSASSISKLKSYVSSSLRLNEPRKIVIATSKVEVKKKS